MRLCSLLFLVGLAGASLGAAPTAPKLNVLFLVADDLNCDLGCYGVPEMKTPNIDRLAARGVRFDHAYCQYPLCSPSRTSFLTGRRPNATGIYTNPGQQNPFAFHFRANLPDTVTLPQLFKNNGWMAVRVGKLYHFGVPNDIGTSSLDDYFSWDFVVNPRGRDREEHDRINSLNPANLGATLSWLADEEGEDADHTDGIGATEAVKLLERFKRESRPFFLAVGFYRPHTPYVAPKKYFDLYPRDQIKIPALSAEDRARQPAPAYVLARPEEDAATDEQRRSAIQGYHAATSFMDAQLGRVVDALDRLGLADNTVIVFLSDHGYHLGDHGLWHKRTLFERGTRVPLIIAVPGTAAKGRVAPGLAELLDLYPTLAALCGLKAPDYLDGKNLSPVLQDPTVTVRDATLMQVRRVGNLDGYAVRSGRWRYIEWDGGKAGRQLFDEETDPAEATNLVDVPKMAPLIAEWHALIDHERGRK